MIKTGIINKKTDIKKLTEEELEKFAEKSDEEQKKANNEFVKRCEKEDNICEE
ncbi:MAG: hypothetical protein ACFFG0_05250 [Candidatus Thorarchaeota archaeon]